MFLTLLANLAGGVATVLAWASLLPQILKLSRTGDTSGVSVTWPAIGLVTNVAWTLYLSVQRLWLAAPSAVVMVVFYAQVLRMLSRSGASLRRPAIAGPVWALALVVIGVLGEWEVLGLALGWSYLIQVTPAVVSAYATRDPTGIAPGTWVIIVIEAALWLFYGWHFQDPALMIFAVIGIVAGGLILGRYVGRESRAAV